MDCGVCCIPMCFLFHPFVHSFIHSLGSCIHSIIHSYFHLCVHSCIQLICKIFAATCFRFPDDCALRVVLPWAHEAQVRCNDCVSGWLNESKQITEEFKELSFHQLQCERGVADRVECFICFCRHWHAFLYSWKRTIFNPHSISAPQWPKVSVTK